MLLTLVAAKMAGLLDRSKEGYADVDVVVTTQDEENTTSSGPDDAKAARWFGRAGLTLALIVLAWELVMCTLAVYLSWTSNSLIGWSAVPKVFFAICAFLCGTWYVVMHVVNKLDMVLYIKRLYELRALAQSLAPQAAAAAPSGPPAVTLGGRGRSGGR
jgi:hypothetical protein